MFIKQPSCDWSTFASSRQAAANGAQLLPCLNSNNSSRPKNTGSNEPKIGKWDLSQFVYRECEALSPYHKKAVLALEENIQAHIEDVGIERIGFLTLTFKSKLFDYKRATKCFNSFVSSVRFKRSFGKWWRVAEMHSDGSWHFHLLVDCLCDVRSGFNWLKYDEARKRKNRNLRKACPLGHSLREMWKVTQNMKRDSATVGRIEILPIRSNAEGCSRYLSKYLSKGFIDSANGSRRIRKERRRLTGKGAGAVRRMSAQFAWYSSGARKYRAKLARIAEHFALTDISDFSVKWGKRWAYKLKQLIRSLPELDHERVPIVDINIALSWLRIEKKGNGEVRDRGDYCLPGLLAKARALGRKEEKRILDILKDIAGAQTYI